MWSQSQPFQFSQPTQSDIKPEVHDVAVLHNVVLALDAQLAGLAHGGLRAVLYVVVILDYLGADEAFSKSVCITPAHCGAFQPFLYVHAFTSISPAVMNVSRFSRA